MRWMEQIRVHVVLRTQEEAALIREAAEHDQRTVSAWARLALLATARQTSDPSSVTQKSRE